MTENEILVLTFLAEKPNAIFSFDVISKSVCLTRDEVRSACHSLRKGGFADYFTGSSVGGGFRGSGYMILLQGQQWLESAGHVVAAQGGAARCGLSAAPVLAPDSR